MPDFNSPASVDEWLQANGGVEGMRHAVETGRFANRNKVEAEAWLRAHDREQLALADKAERELAERNVKAAEVAAHAAAASAKWAKWAAIIAVVAAVISVAQYLAPK
jgi:hypothetical protein